MVVFRAGIRKGLSEPFLQTDFADRFGDGGPAADRLADQYVGGVNRGPAALDDEAREIVSEARELTQEMQAEEGSDAEGRSESDEGETE